LSEELEILAATLDDVDEPTLDDVDEPTLDDVDEPTFDEATLAHSYKKITFRIYNFKKYKSQQYKKIQSINSNKSAINFSIVFSFFVIIINSY
jgi:hypothetical protein